MSYEYDRPPRFLLTPISMVKDIDAHCLLLPPFVYQQDR
jgi:hypothetical protein